MTIRVAAFTDKGRGTANRIFENWTEDTVILREKGEALDLWTEKAFKEHSALVFIGAMGIAVRVIAPFVKDKLEDSPVIVLDEQGENVIPVLSGHVGGANELANKIAEKIGARPIITTATDINGVFAVDVFAQKNGLNIINREGIAKVSSKVLSGEIVTICSQNRPEEGISIPKELRIVDYPPKEPVDVIISTSREYDELASLSLEPRTLVLGIGCKKGKNTEAIEALIADNGIDMNQVKAVASIDVKKNEPGLVGLCSAYRVPFMTFSADELMEAEGEFTKSNFVKSQVGVDNVCERAAMLAAGEKGELIIKKQAKDGVTLAVVKIKWRINFE